MTTSTPTIQTASFIRRMIALCYETVLLVALILVLGGIYQFIFPTLEDSTVLKLALFIYVVLLVGIYFGFCWIKGQTLAMKTWRIHLRTVDNQRLSIKLAILRYTIIFIAVAPVIPIYVMVKHDALPHYMLWIATIWAISPYVWAIVDQDKQFLQDRILRTRLIFMAPAQKKPQTK